MREHCPALLPSFRLSDLATTTAANWLRLAPVRESNPSISPNLGQRAGIEPAFLGHAAAHTPQLRYRRETQGTGQTTPSGACPSMHAIRSDRFTAEAEAAKAKPTKAANTIEILRISAPG
jgi:hypothetical protein